jgi:hypothetical protein
MHTSAPVVSSLPSRPTDVSGFRVVSRESLKADPFARKGMTQDYGQYAAQDHGADPVSPSASSFYCVATKSSYNVLPKDDLQVELPTPRAEATFRSAESVADEEESELEYLAPPLSAVGSQWTGTPPNASAQLPMRNDSVYTTGSVYSEHPAPVDLGKPLPIPPTAPHFSAHRDTLFSVIEGYGTRGTGEGGDEGRWYHAAPGQVLRPVALRANASPDEVYRDSTYTDDQDIRLDSVSLDDASSTWDLSAEQSDETVLDEIMFESFGDGEETEVLEPPPKLEDIEAIARQHSPGRYGHGIPLEFGESFASGNGEGADCFVVDEESEGGTEEDARIAAMPTLGRAIA